MAQTRQGRDLTEAHKQAQIDLSETGVADFIDLTAGLLDPARLDGTRIEWAGYVATSLERQHQASASLAATYLDTYRRIEGGGSGIPIGLAALDLGSAVGSLDFMIARAKTTTGTVGPRMAVSGATNLMVGAIQRHILAGGRDTIDQATLANPNSVGWRRVTDGKPCAFCALLASRGPVYTNANNAGQGRRFHDRCGCTIEEVIGDWRPTAAERRLQELADGAAGSLQDRLQQMRQRGQGVVNDAKAPATQAGSGGGGATPPRRSGPSAGDPERPRDVRRPRERTPEDFDLWAERQRALGFRTNGQDMKPHEIEFAERMAELGETIDEWLAAGEMVDGVGRLPSNDLRWKGREFELKRTHAKYAAVKALISKATKAAGAHGVRKSAFIVDFGGERISAKLRTQLAQYNERTQGMPIAELWALTPEGLEEIDLK
ncbi:MAG: hypothetical protein L0G99_04435 [Propionibacteriales bacterium]|nr:hypothetical protein [Propionibacteriales bacterium]